MGVMKVESNDMVAMEKIKSFAKSIGVKVEDEPILLASGKVLQLAPKATAKDGLRTLSEIEFEAIVNTVKACRGNLTEAAKTLKIGRATLYRKIKEYGIKGQSSREEKAA